MVSNTLLTEICAEIKNYFAKDEEKFIGNFEISDHVITPSLTLQTDYIRIVGSHKNDGVHKLPDTTLADETFDGAVWAMCLPPAFLALCEDISAWQAKYGMTDSVALSPFSSESFGGYSYSKASAGGGSGDADGAAGWKNVFAQRLKLWRKFKV